MLRACPCYAPKAARASRTQEKGDQRHNMGAYEAARALAGCYSPTPCVAHAKPVALTRALRARRARPPEVPEAAARAACVSTWLGELNQYNCPLDRARHRVARLLAHCISIPLSHVATKMSKNAQRGPRCARQARQRLAKHPQSRQGARSASHMHRVMKA